MKSINNKLPGLDGFIRTSYFYIKRQTLAQVYSSNPWETLGACDQEFMNRESKQGILYWGGLREKPGVLCQDLQRTRSINVKGAACTPESHCLPA